MNTEEHDAPALQEHLLETLERLLALDATDLPALLAAASQLIARVMGADKVDIFLPDPPTGDLVAVGTSDTPMGRRQRTLGLHRLPLAQGGRVAHVYATDTPFCTGRADQDPAERPDIPRDLGVRSLLATPLDGRGAPRGVLAVSSAQPDRYSSTDVRFLTIVAHVLDLMTHKAALLRRLEDLTPAASINADLDQAAAERQRQREIAPPPAALPLPDVAQARLVRWRLGQLEAMAQHAEATAAVVQAAMTLNESKLALIQETIAALHGQISDLQGALAGRDRALRAATAQQAELAEQLRQAQATIAALQAHLQLPPAGAV